MGRSSAKRFVAPGATMRARMLPGWHSQAVRSQRGVWAQARTRVRHAWREMPSFCIFF
jgi:hypothetical protein